MSLPTDRAFESYPLVVGDVIANRPADRVVRVLP